MLVRPMLVDPLRTACQTQACRSVVCPKLAGPADGPVADLTGPPAHHDGTGQPHQIDAYEDNVRSGGPPPDGIPSIDALSYVAPHASTLGAEGPLVL